MKTQFLIKVALGAMLLTVLSGAANLITGTSPGASHYLWSILANFLVAGVLGYLIQYSIYHGLQLSVIVFIVYFIIGHFNLQVEALIFNVTNRSETLRELFSGLLVAAVFSPVYVRYIFRKDTPRQPLGFIPRSAINWIGKVILGDFLYLIFYLGAGLVLAMCYPQILQFYEGKLPSFGLMIQTQLFLRGLIFVGIAVLILRTTELSAGKKAILTGLVFAILGGIAPLIPPNELMPAYVRVGHGVEAGISNFSYGFVLAYLLGQKPQRYSPQIPAEKPGISMIS